MFKVVRIVGDSKSNVVFETEDLVEALDCATLSCSDEMPNEIDEDNEDFDSKDYEGYAKVIDDDNDRILYWVNGEGKCGSDLSEDDLDEEDVYIFEIIKEYLF